MSDPSSLHVILYWWRENFDTSPSGKNGLSDYELYPKRDNTALEKYKELMELADENDSASLEVQAYHSDKLAAVYLAGLSAGGIYSDDLCIVSITLTPADQAALKLINMYVPTPCD